MPHSPEHSPQPEVSEDEIVQYLQRKTETDTDYVDGHGHSLLVKDIADLSSGNAKNVVRYLEAEVEWHETHEHMEMKEKVEKYIAFLKDRYPQSS